MLASTRASLDDWYAGLFGIDHEDLWCDLTVRTHTVLGDYAGVYVAWRDAGVHVSVPPGWSALDAGALGQEEIGTLQDPAYWLDFAQQRGLQRIGPATHTCLDVDPGPADGVVELGRSALSSLRDRVSAEDWAESGWPDDPPHAFGLVHEGVVVAAANLNERGGVARDVGVLVAPEHRGQGLAGLVGRRAASYAVQRHGYATWGAREDNVASLATARRLGFEPWCTQLAVRA